MANPTNDIDYKSWVGKIIRKKSGKPFPSKLTRDIAVGIEINPKSKRNCFRLFTCNTLIECKHCVLVSNKNML